MSVYKIRTSFPGRLLTYFAYIFFFCAQVAPAWAACSNPAAQAGAIDYTYSGAYRYCNGFSWWTFVLGSNSGSCSKVAEWQYDTSSHKYKICNGSNYQELDCEENTLVSAVGGGQDKSSTGTFKPASGVSLSSNETILVCAAMYAKGYPTYAQWNGNGLTDMSYSDNGAGLLVVAYWGTGFSGTGDVEIGWTSPGYGTVAAVVMKVTDVGWFDTYGSSTYGYSTGMFDTGNTNYTNSANQFLHACVGVHGPSTDGALGFNNGFTDSQATGTSDNDGWDVTVYDGYRFVDTQAQYSTMKNGYQARNYAAVLLPYQFTGSASCIDYGVCAGDGKMEFSSPNFLWCNGGSWTAFDVQ